MVSSRAAAAQRSLWRVQHNKIKSWNGNSGPCQKHTHKAHESNQDEALLSDQQLGLPTLACEESNNSEQLKPTVPCQGEMQYLHPEKWMHLCDMSQENEKSEPESGAESFTTKTKDGFLSFPANL